MSDSFYDEKKEERRKFPRVKAQCPVNYFTRTTGNWSEAVLQDYSIGGICFVCDETLQQNTQITIQIPHGAHKEVPPMAASAVVVRCEMNDDHHYKIGCQFTRERRVNVAKISRFGPGYR